MPVANLRRKQPSSLPISRDAAGGGFGPGPLYYVARLRYYLPADRIPTRNVGVGVGRQYLNLTGHAITTATAGSVAKVKLTFDVPHTLQYLNVDDPIPAGFEPIDETLNTSQQGLLGRYGGQPFVASGKTVDLSGYISHTDIRDDHVAVYAPYVPPGKFTYTYLAEQACRAATESHRPTLQGRSFPKSLAAAQAKIWRSNKKRLPGSSRLYSGGTAAAFFRYSSSFVEG